MSPFEIPILFLHLLDISLDPDFLFFGILCGVWDLGPTALHELEAQSPNLWIAKEVSNSELLTVKVPAGSASKESACNARDLGLTLELGKIPWRREWQSLLVFLPGEFHGQSSPVGYSPWGPKESDTTE